MTRVLIGLTGGLFGLELGASAAPRTLLAGLQPMALAADPAAPARVYCATYNRGLWRSEDAGETWVPVGTPQRYRPAGPVVRPLEYGSLREGICDQDMELPGSTQNLASHATPSIRLSGIVSPLRSGPDRNNIYF